MPFSLPTFNTQVFIWHQAPPPFIWQIPPVGLPNVVANANVSLGRRVLTGTDAQTPHDPRSGVGIDVIMRVALFPAGTDVRCLFQNWLSVLEMPSGSGAFYGVLDVADMGKGFANEHRLVWFVPIFDGITFLPVPLP